MARAAGMDLVEVDGAQRPPVCKLQDAGKAAFQAAQREKVCPRSKYSHPRASIQPYTSLTLYGKSGTVNGTTRMHVGQC